jgi:type I restriction enzyme, S subunit
VFENENNLKPGWKVWRFDQMATNVNVRIENPSESGMEHYVGLEHLDADSLKIRRWGTPDDVEATKLMFQKGDIIFGRRRAYQRKLGVAEFDGICSAHAMVLRAKPEVVLPEFLPFFMQSDLFMNRAVEISVGSLSPTINWKTMAVQEFTMPPLEVQRQLADLLESLHATIESHSDLAIAAEKLLESSRDEVFSDANLKRDKLGNLGGVRYGVGQPPPQIDNGVPMIRATNIDRGKISSKDLMLVDSNAVAPSRRITLQEGDILVVRSGAYTGDSAIIDREWAGSLAGYDLVVSINREKIDPRYVAEYLLAKRTVVSVLTALSARTAQPHLNADDLSGVLIPIAERDEQEILVQRWFELKEAKEAALLRKASVLKMKDAVIADTWGVTSGI